RWLATFGNPDENSIINICDLQNAHLYKSIKLGETDVRGLVLSNTSLAYLSAPRTEGPDKLTLWDIENDRVVGELPTADQPIALSSDGQLLAAGSTKATEDKPFTTISLWETSPFRKKFDLRSEHMCFGEPIAFSEDRTEIVCNVVIDLSSEVVEP